MKLLVKMIVFSRERLSLKAENKLEYRFMALRGYSDWGNKSSLIMEIHRKKNKGFHMAVKYL